MKQLARFGAPLDIFLVRKIGVPGYQELAIVAVARDEPADTLTPLAQKIPPGPR
jgi:predicted phosphoribosyltransferase